MVACLRTTASPTSILCCAVETFLSPTTGGTRGGLQFRQISDTETRGRFFPAKLLFTFLPKQGTEGSPAILMIRQLRERHSDGRRKSICLSTAETRPQSECGQKGATLRLLRPIPKGIN